MRTKQPSKLPPSLPINLSVISEEKKLVIRRQRGKLKARLSKARLLRPSGILKTYKNQF